MCSPELPISLLLGKSENLCEEMLLSQGYQVLLLSNSAARSIIQWLVVFAGVLKVIFCVICLKCNTVRALDTVWTLCLLVSLAESREAKESSC